MEPEAERPLISIVCPVFNEEAAVESFYERLMGVLRPFDDRYRFELIFANNRSTDATAERVLAMREKDPGVQLLTLSRNYGYQFNVLSGIRQAAGEAIIIIDVDCEDPPELIPQFLAGFEDGYDVVYGERDRRREPLPLTWARKIFYRLNKRIADSDIILDMAEFSLISATVRDAVASTRNTFPFLRAEIAHYGFRRKGIRYNREERIGGQSHYNLWGLVVFAVAGILASTTLPLRLGLFLLPPLLVVNAGLLFLDARDLWAPAFEVLVSLDFVYLATQLAFASLYLSRIYRNVIGRPVAVDWNASHVNLPIGASRNFIRPPRETEPADARDLPSLLFS